MYERILVPLDGSQAAEVVLPYAEEIAAKFAAEIVLVSVSESTVAEMDHLYRSYIERIAEQVQHQLKKWGVKKEAKVPSDVLIGNPATEILRYADESSASLIIMASRGCSSEGSCEEPWLLGNIASKILQTAGKPVLLIRAPASSAALQRKGLVKKILVPLDVSRVGEAAIPHAEALARVLEAQVILFHVLELAPIPVMVAPGIQIPYPPVSAEQEARTAVSAIEYLEGMEKALAERGINASSETSSGSPATEIMKYADANAVDLIAMSSHGRSGIGRWVFGSVTEKLLQAGNTAILTVRATHR